MKIKINGFDVEGTPEEISSILKLVDSQVLEKEYVPVYPTYPGTTYPAWPYYPLITWC